MLLLLSTAFASAQHRFSVSVTGGPVVSHASTKFTILLPDQSGQPIPTTFDNRSTITGHLIGLSAHYSFTANWSISTGLWYNRLGTDGTNPFDPITTPARIISQDFQVPFFINYRLGHKRLSPYFSAGALANFRQSTIYRVESTSGQDDIKVRFGKSMNVRAVVGAGIAYQLNSQLALIFQPQLVWHVKPKGDYERYVAYQVNGQCQLMYSF